MPSLASMSLWIRRAPTAALGVLFAAAILVEAAALAQSWGLRYWAFGGPAAAVVCALALLRHRRPIVLAVAGLAVAALAILVAHLAGRPAEPGPAMALGLAVLVGSAVRRQPPVPAGAIAAGGLAIVVAGQLASSGASEIAPVTTIGAPVWLLSVVVGVSLRLLDDRARDTAERVRTTERLELARELHDVVAHHITAMLIQAQATQVVARRDPGAVPESLAGMETAGAEALTAMRRVVGLLRDADDTAPTSPGPEQLAALVDRFARQGPAVRLKVPPNAASWPPEVTTTLYRVVQEALTNVARHAPGAGSVSVIVDDDPRGLTLEIVDDAPPSAPRRRGGYGLVGMRERVEALGGTLDAGPRPAGGWSVRAVLPASTVAAR